jgi:hypothetical protein
VSKYTPGPWEYQAMGTVQIREDESEVARWHPAHVVAAWSYGGGRMVTAFICDCNSRTLPNAANARLIASAPDLLDALRAINDSATDGRECPEWLQERLDVARVAIAKAERK